MTRSLTATIYLSNSGLCSKQQVNSPILRDLGNPSLQPLLIAFARLAQAKLVEKDDLGSDVFASDSLGLCFFIQEDNAGLLVAAPHEADATGSAVPLDEQIDLARDRYCVREKYSCSVGRHVSDEAINLEPLIAVRNGSAEECPSALQLTTFKHGPASYNDTVANFDQKLSKPLAVAGRVTCEPAIKVNCGAPAMPQVGVAA